MLSVCFCPRFCLLKKDQRVALYMNHVAQLTFYPTTKILTNSKLKEFAANNINVTQKSKLFLKGIQSKEYIAEKGENSYLLHFSFSLFLRVVKS